MKKCLALQLRYKFLLFIALLFVNSNSVALVTEERLESQLLESQAQEIFKQIRCLVCQGQSIYGSDTEFSLSLKRVIRERLSQGLSNQEIIEDLAENFGDQILVSSDYSNKIEKGLILLPIILVLIVIFLFFKKITWKGPGN